MNAQGAGTQGLAPVVQGLFKGIAVVIDDGVKRNEADILLIVNAIREGGGLPVVLNELPSEDADLENFSNVAFFIMDWNLLDIQPGGGVQVPAGLKEDMVRGNLAFLKRLGKHRHAPVFIFTNDEPGEVIAALQDDADLGYRPEESHILVKRKSDVGGEVYRVLNDWADQVPSVIALKAWERNFVSAVNAMFADFHNRSPHWPVMFWQAAATDGVPPTEELGRLITRLVTSRMRALEIDLEPFAAAMQEDEANNPEAYNRALMQVLEGERVVLNERLDAGSVAPGDFFEETGEDGSKRYLLNIRAECDCVIRSGNYNPYLYLLKGRVRDPVTVIDKRLGNAVEKDNEAIVFAMLGGQTISFSFRDLRVEKWNAWKDKRKGRLLMPFLSRIVQRYAAYSQRPGLPRLPPALLERIKPDDDAGTAPDTAPTCNLLGSGCE